MIVSNTGAMSGVVRYGGFGAEGTYSGPKDTHLARAEGGKVYVVGEGGKWYVSTPAIWSALGGNSVTAITTEAEIAQYKEVATLEETAAKTILGLPAMAVYVGGGILGLAILAGGGWFAFRRPRRAAPAMAGYRRRHRRSRR